MSYFSPAPSNNSDSGPTFNWPYWFADNNPFDDYGGSGGSGGGGATGGLSSGGGSGYSSNSSGGCPPGHRCETDRNGHTKVYDDNGNIVRIIPARTNDDDVNDAIAATGDLLNEGGKGILIETTAYYSGEAILGWSINAFRAWRAGRIAQAIAAAKVVQKLKALKSAEAAYKGSTKLGHSLSKHAQRNPGIWGKLKGNASTWHDQAIKHFDEIMDGSGNFIEKINDRGIKFLEKMLPDGRGIRLNMDGTFKSFID